MNKIKILVLASFIVNIVHAQSIPNLSITTSFVDVFPLAIGNQWTYGYYWEYNDVFQSHPMYHSCDTGIVIIQVIGKVSAPDSTRWMIHEESRLCSQYNNMPFSDPRTVIDTFEIIELHAGNHQIYSIGSRFATANSVFPFPFPSPYPFNEQDTMEIERFRSVDSVGVVRFDFWGDAGYLHKFTFKQSVGLQAVTTMSLCLCGETWSGNHVLRNSIINSISPNSTDGLPQTYYLAQNFPNPFNPSTTINFGVLTGGFVSMKIYDFLGREVATLVSEEMSQGRYAQDFDGSNLANGVYLCRMQAGHFVQTRKLLLLK